jgi:two-component system, cell cycle sensor histidine kinase and response regulator CckA
MFESEIVNIVEIVGDAIEGVSSSLPVNVTIESHRSAQQIFISGDASHSQLAVSNILVNSSEAIAESTGFIRVVLSETVMTAEDLGGFERTMCTQLPAGPYALIELSDTGAGISTDNIAKIFDPFFTTKFMVRGLGLSEVFGIVTAHKGGIAVERTTGNGTTFKIVFPLVHETRGETTKPSTKIGLSLRSPKVSAVGLLFCGTIKFY